MEWHNVEYSNGAHYEGFANENMKRLRVGGLKLASGDYYVGEWEGGMMSGIGKYSFKDGDAYVGDLSEGQFKGDGYTTNYIGQYSDNKKHGEGICISDPHILKQSWKHGKLTSSSKASFVDHAKGLNLRATLWVRFIKLFPHPSPKTEADYVSELVTKEHTYPSKCVYSGSFLGTKKTGFGTWSHPDGDTYVGYWFDNCKETWGKYTTSPEKFYVGYWKDDKMSGWGVYHMSSTEYYISHFVTDRKSGKCLHHQEGSPAMSQIWDSGKLISEREAKKDEITQFEEVREYVTEICENIAP